jgi:hypothetical protein
MESNENRADVQFAGEDVWKAIDAIRGVGGSLRLAVAYLSSDTRLRLQRGDAAIVDASDSAIKSSQTSAKVLDSAFKIGVKLFSHDHLHAKVITTGTKILVGSANVSQTSPDLAEAAITSSDASALATANAWWERRKAESIEIDSEFIAKIKLIPVEHRGRGKRSKPTLAEALEDDSPVLSDFLYGWETSEAELSDKTVTNEAKKKGILLPADCWTWFEWDKSTKPLLKSIRDGYQGKPCLQLETLNDGDEIKQFKRVLPYTTSFIAAFPIQGRIVMVALKQNAPGLKLNGRGWPKTLMDRLTRGLAALPSVKKRIADRKSSIIELSELKQIYRAGE